MALDMSARPGARRRCPIIAGTWVRARAASTASAAACSGTRRAPWRALQILFDPVSFGRATYRDRLRDRRPRDHAVGGLMRSPRSCRQRRSARAVRAPAAPSCAPPIRMSRRLMASGCLRRGGGQQSIPCHGSAWRCRPLSTAGLSFGVAGALRENRAPAADRPAPLPVCPAVVAPRHTAHYV